MFLRDLVAGGPVLADGAWGTELDCLGLPPGDCPDGWNLLQPELMREVASAYIQAGSRVIRTNTFRANAISLAPWRLESAVAEINWASARIGREAAGSGTRVFGSIGPTGEQLAANHLMREAAYAAFAEQAAALAAGGAHAQLLETFSDIEEARIALRAVRTTGLPAIVSFTFRRGRNRDRSLSGATPEQAASAMTEARRRCGGGRLQRPRRDRRRLPPHAGVHPPSAVDQAEHGRRRRAVASQRFASPRRCGRQLRRRLLRVYTGSHPLRGGGARSTKRGTSCASR